MSTLAPQQASSVRHHFFTAPDLPFHPSFQLSCRQLGHQLMLPLKWTLRCSETRMPTQSLAAAFSPILSSPEIFIFHASQLPNRNTSGRIDAGEVQKSGNLSAVLLKDNSPRGEIINSTNQGTFSWIYRNSSLLSPINMSIFQAIFLSWDKCMISTRWSSYSSRIFTFMALKTFLQCQSIVFHAHIFSLFVKMACVYFSYPSNVNLFNIHTDQLYIDCKICLF